MTKQKKEFVGYYASSTPIDYNDELYAESSEKEALDALYEREEIPQEVYVYEIKIKGKFKVKFELESFN